MKELATYLMEFDTMKHYLAFFFVALALVTVAVIIDLCTGLSKAIAKRDAIMSNPLRRTLVKVLEYWGLQMIALIIDLLLCLTPIEHPYTTMFVSIAIVAIEIKSVFENLSERKSAAAKVQDIVTKIIAASDNETALKIVEIIKKM